MEFINLQGKRQQVHTLDYRIKWMGPSPSKYQKSIKDFLYKYWVGDLVTEEFSFRPTYGSVPLRFDFFNVTRRCVVEADSELHFKENSHFHQKKDSFLDSVNRDVIKDEWAELNKIKVVRIYPEHFPLEKEKLEKLYGKFL